MSLNEGGLAPDSPRHDKNLEPLFFRTPNFPGPPGSGVFSPFWHATVTRAAHGERIGREVAFYLKFIFNYGICE